MHSRDKKESSRDLGGKLALVAGGLLVPLIAAEIGLRLVGFVFTLEPAVQFGWPDPVTLERTYRSDPDLLWVPQDYPERLRQAAAAPADVVFMGDSCTEFGTYAEQAIALLSGDGTARAGLNVGVGGWSSEQGRRQLMRDVIPLQPRIITIYYGWNDHWMALGPIDSELPLPGTIGLLERELRLAQLVLKARMALSTSRRDRQNRVPLPRYEENLRAMVDAADRAGIRPILITAPTNHVEGREPEYLLARHLRTLDELVPLHRAYLDVTRRIATEEGATLCDAATSFAADPSLNQYFNEDGIHLSEMGNRRMAEVLSECIRRTLN